MITAQEGVLAAPPVAVTAASLFGYTMSDIVLFATLAYTSLLFVHKVWQWFKEAKDRDELKFGRRSTDVVDDE